jgi:hypothetical protein
MIEKTYRPSGAHPKLLNTFSTDMMRPRRLNMIKDEPDFKK